MKKQVHVFYSGNVQGVGFRYTAHSIAKRLMLSGFVKNLSDGRVEVVAEGEEGDIKEMLADIKAKMNYCHFTESLSWAEPTGRYTDFGITF